MSVIYAGPADYGDHKPLNVEGVAVAATLPGTVVSQTAAGLAVNASASTVDAQQLLIADKDQQRSRGVDDQWAISENMVAIQLRSGEFANVRVEPGVDITNRGFPLALNGSGLLTGATLGTDYVIAYADEIVNTTGGPAAGTLVRVKGA